MSLAAERTYLAYVRTALALLAAGVAVVGALPDLGHEGLRRAIGVLLVGRDPQTPVVVGRDVGRDEEQLITTTLGELDPTTVDMRSLVIVGSSSTQRRADSAVWTARSVE